VTFLETMLASIGLVQIILYGKILSGLRTPLKAWLKQMLTGKTNEPWLPRAGRTQRRITAKILEFMECSMCAGFWAGLALSGGRLRWALAASFLSYLADELLKNLESRNEIE